MDVGARKAGTEAGYKGWDGGLYNARRNCLRKSREEVERCTNQTMAPDALLQNRHDRRNGRSPWFWHF